MLSAWSMAWHAEDRELRHRKTRFPRLHSYHEISAFSIPRSPAQRRIHKPVQQLDTNALWSTLRFNFESKLLERESSGRKSIFQPRGAENAKTSRAIEVAAVPSTRRMSTTLSTLKGDYLQRRSDPRLFRLSVNLVRCAVILYVVALHESSLEPVILNTPCHSLQLERNAGGGHRQCVPPRDSY
jgi:hypothetical protein